MIWTAAFRGSFSLYKESTAIHLPTWQKQRSGKAVQCLCFSLVQRSATTAASLSVIPHEDFRVLLVNEAFWISNAASVWHGCRKEILKTWPAFTASYSFYSTSWKKQKNRNRCWWWSLNHAGLCLCHICNFIRWSPSFLYIKQNVHRSRRVQFSGQDEKKTCLCANIATSIASTSICACEHYSVFGLYTVFYASSAIPLKKGTIYTHQKNTPLPTFQPVNSWILAHGFEKGDPLERKLWDDGESCARKYKHVHWEKKYVGCDQWCTGNRGLKKN